MIRKLRRWLRDRRGPWMTSRDDWFYDPKKDPRVRPVTGSGLDALARPNPNYPEGYADDVR